MPKQPGSNKKRAEANESYTVLLARLRAFGDGENKRERELREKSRAADRRETVLDILGG